MVSSDDGSQNVQPKQNKQASIFGTQAVQVLQIDNNSFYRGYTDHDVQRSQLQRRINSERVQSHALQQDSLTFYQDFNILEHAAMNKMGITPWNLNCVNLGNLANQRSTPVIRQSKDPTNLLPDGSYPDTKHFMGHLVCPYAPTVWDFPMQGETKLDKEIRNFFSRWQNVEASCLPLDADLLAVLFQLGGEHYFLGSLLRKLSPCLDRVVVNLEQTQTFTPEHFSTLKHIQKNLYAIIEVIMTQKMVFSNIVVAFNYRNDGSFFKFKEVVKRRCQEYRFQNSEEAPQLQSYRGMFLDPATFQNSLEGKKQKRLSKKRKLNQSSPFPRNPENVPPAQKGFPNYVCHTCGSKEHFRKFCPMEINKPKGGAVQKPSLSKND